MITTRSVVLSFAVSCVGLSCQKTSPRSAELDPGIEPAMLSMLFDPAGGLSGEPNVYEIKVSPEGASTILRGGDLPQAGQVISIDNLPAANAATVTGGLFRDKPDNAHKTHACRAAAPISLVAGQTTSVAMTCTEVSNADGAPSVTVFLKVAKVSLTFATQTAADILGARDWKAALQFAATDAQGRRISVVQDAHGLKINVGGELTYATPLAASNATMDSAPARAPIESLIAGETLPLEAISGQLHASAPEPATVKLSNAPVLYEEDDGTLTTVLPIELANETGAVKANGRLLEEPFGSEFMVVSYNVENLFDQTDEDRNVGYGDYRIAPNPQGNYSNWGEPVVLDGVTMTWTDVKIAGIRKALTALDPAGPAVVGLVEIESRAALERLGAAVQDLGYQTVQFSDWPDDMPKTAIGLGLISKFPMREWGVVRVIPPAQDANAPASIEAPRPILRVTLDVSGYPLTVYVNHWKSKSGPESQRKAYAEALQRDIDALVQTNPRADYLILGDLNSEYNETVIIEDGHNDTNRVTGINHVIKAQGDELAVLKMTNPTLKYNLHYELNRSERYSAWHAGFGWSSLDHIIVGSGLYDRTGITYVDGSFMPTNSRMPRTRFLFKEDGTTKRWMQQRAGKVTTHVIGGYADHLPIVARFHVPVRQSPATIRLQTPGDPDATDPKL